MNLAEILAMTFVVLLGIGFLGALIDLLIKIVRGDFLDKGDK